MTARARVFTYDVTLDDDWAARSALGGATIPEEEAWTPEHLLLAALCRCTLTSFRYHARRAGHEPLTRASGHGVVTRREDDGRFALVEARIDVHVDLPTRPAPAEVAALIMKGERDCFVGASLTAKPDYHWTVNGEDFS